VKLTWEWETSKANVHQLTAPDKLNETEVPNCGNIGSDLL